MQFINNNFTKYWLPIFLWAGSIYFISDQPSLKSPFDPLWDMILRKILHMAEFGALAALLARMLGFYKIIGGKAWFLVLSLSFFYAIFDEVHQSFIQGRYGTIRDMMIDFNGSFLGMIGWQIYGLRPKKKRKR